MEMKYANKTILGLAHERGANGNIKKRQTAWQYLLNTIRANDIPLHRHNNRIDLDYELQHPDCSRSYAHTCRQHTAAAKAKYIREQWLERIERTGDALCHAHGYQLRTETPGELLPYHIKYRAEMLERIDKSLKHTYSLSTLPRAPQDWDDPDYYLCVSGRTIVLHRSVTRTAYIMREGWDDLSTAGLLRNTDFDKVCERKINYKARGNWIQNIIIELLSIIPERQRGLSHIQLDPHYRVKRIRKITGIEIWSRALAGEVVDYCAVADKDTFHAATPRAAIHGLASKLATPGSRREILSMDYALSLGFCRSGVEQFCEDYELNPDSAYPRSEIQAIVSRGSNGKAKKYEKELTKAGITI